MPDDRGRAGHALFANPAIDLFEGGCYLCLKWSSSPQSPDPSSVGRVTPSVSRSALLSPVDESQVWMEVGFGMVQEPTLVVVKNAEAMSAMATKTVAEVLTFGQTRRSRCQLAARP